MRDDCTPPKCGKLSEYTDSAHTEVEDPSLGCMNVSNMYDRCGHDTRQLHPSCTACIRTANLPGFELLTFRMSLLSNDISHSSQCYPVCGMVHIKEPLLLIGKNSPCGGSGFPLSYLSGPLPFVRRHITVKCVECVVK